MAAVTVYDHIRQNNIKTILLALLFPVVLTILIGIACLLAVATVQDKEFLLNGIYLLLRWFPSLEASITPDNATFFAAMGYLTYAIVPIFVVAGLWMIVSLATGDKMMLGFAGAEPLEKSDNPTVYRLVENVAIAAGLPMPKVYVIDDESLNAFATGYSPKSASIALTTGIIQKLEPIELEGVIAHEMAHIGNRDIRLNMLIITGLGIFAFVADFIRLNWAFRSSKNDKNGLQVLLFFIIIALLIFNFIFAPLIHMAISRTREYAADATGALITRNPQALARALRKIQTDARVEVLDKQPTMATACIADPTAKKHEIAALSDLSSTHPPIEDRIRRLQAMG